MMLGLLVQPSHVVEERRSLMAQMSTLKKAAAVLQRDPQIAGRRSTDICFHAELLLYFLMLLAPQAVLPLPMDLLCRRFLFSFQ